MLVNDSIYHYLVVEAENFPKERIIHTSHESWWCEGKDRLNLMVEVLVLNSRDKKERTSKRDANERKLFLTSDFKGIVHASWKIVTAHLVPSSEKKNFENLFSQISAIKWENLRKIPIRRLFFPRCCRIKPNMLPWISIPAWISQPNIVSEIG